jgi:hypothetical protein
VRFLDRREELARLDRLRPPALAVLWGRRRVGKTRLLLEWSRRHGGLYAVGDQSNEVVQRRYLAEAMGLVFPGFGDVEYPDWRSFFGAVAREATRSAWRGPLVIDELPYLVAASPALQSVLQNFVDREAKDAGILLVVAGSTQRMMQGLVLDGSSPLYGRATEAFEVKPLSPSYLGDALGLKDPVDCVRAFAVWGGIPRYWELAEPTGADLARAVDTLVLDPHGPLHGEPDRLLLEEQPPAPALRPLLDAIGSGAHRLFEIGGRLGLPATSLTRPLLRLQEIGLVRREQPFGASERSGKRSLYRIADPFFRLWFRTVAPHRSLLAQAPAHVRERLWKNAAPAVFAQAWEELCRTAVPRLERGPLAALGPWGPASPFWLGRGAEWDVVALSLDGRTALLGEARWQDSPASERILDDAYRALVSKGLPDVAEIRDAPRRVHALFVPRSAPGLKRRRLPYVLVEAGDVLSALR